MVTVGESTLAALCQPPYSVYGAVPALLFLFSSRSSATCHIGLLSPVTFDSFSVKKKKLSSVTLSECSYYVVKDTSLI